MSAIELSVQLQREEINVDFSFGVPEDESIAQEAAWTYPLVRLLPPEHDLATREILSVAELLAFPMIACHLGRLPGLRQQMDAVRRRYAVSPIITSEAQTLAGYVTRVASGLGVGVADAGHMTTLCRTDLVVVPLIEDIRVVTCVLHKHQKHRITSALGRFLAHAKTLS